MKNIKVLWIFSLFFIIMFNTLTQGEECSTLFKKKGFCVKINQCSQIFQYLQRSNITDKDKGLIRSMSCNLKEDPTIICCPIEYNTDPDPQVQFPRSDREKSLLPVAPNCGTIQFKETSGDNGETTFYEHPWLALIEYTNYLTNATEHFCSGSLINNRYVLTAAHCITKVQKGWILSGVRLGEWDTSTNPDCLTTCADEYRQYKVEYIYSHPNSTNRIVDGDDMALLYLSENVQFTPFIQPICLPVVRKQETNDYLYHKLETAGWSAAHGVNDRKLKSQAHIWSLHDCQQAYIANKLKLHDHQICAGNTEDETISCYGDAGGPLMAIDSYNSMKAYVLAGVSSFGPSPCGLKGYPNVFTKVGPNMDWIKSIFDLN